MLVATLVGLAVLSALTGGMVVTSVTETIIAARHRDGVVALYAADGLLEQTRALLGLEPDWGPWATPAWRLYRRSSFAEATGRPNAPPIEVEVWLMADALTPGALVARASASSVGGVRRVLTMRIQRDGPRTRVLAWQALR